MQQLCSSKAAISDTIQPFRLSHSFYMSIFEFQPDASSVFVRAPSCLHDPLYAIPTYGYITSFQISGTMFARVFLLESTSLSISSIPASSISNFSMLGFSSFCMQQDRFWSSILQFPYQLCCSLSHVTLRLFCLCLDMCNWEMGRLGNRYKGTLLRKAGHHKLNIDYIRE